MNTPFDGSAVWIFVDAKSVQILSITSPCKLKESLLKPISSGRGQPTDELWRPFDLMKGLIVADAKNSKPAQRYGVGEACNRPRKRRLILAGFAWNRSI